MDWIIVILLIFILLGLVDTYSELKSLYATVDIEIKYKNIKVHSYQNEDGHLFVPFYGQVPRIGELVTLSGERPEYRVKNVSWSFDFGEAQANVLVEKIKTKKARV